MRIDVSRNDLIIEYLVHDLLIKSNESRVCSYMWSRRRSRDHSISHEACFTCEIFTAVVSNVLLHCEITREREEQSARSFPIGQFNFDLKA